MNTYQLINRIKQELASVPVTAIIAIIALTAGMLSELTELLQFDRSAIHAGQVWRLVTCQFTHWNADHLTWDLLMFVVLGSVCERRNPRRFRVCLAATIAAVSATVYFAFPDIHTYRGLSGIDSALFTLLATNLLAEAIQAQSYRQIAINGGLLLGFAAKIAYEATTGGTFFVNHQTAEFIPLVHDHLAGALVGGFVAIQSILNVSPAKNNLRNPTSIMR